VTQKPRTALDLPKFDTGQYGGSDFRMYSGDAELSIRVSGLAPIRIGFQRARWHMFTAMPNCTAEQISSYFRVDEIINSPALSAFIEADSAPTKAYRELHHFRIYLDETGCHEIYAQSCCAL
jgi:hypothetical protein